MTDNVRSRDIYVLQARSRGNQSKKSYFMRLSHHTDGFSAPELAWPKAELESGQCVGSGNSAWNVEVDARLTASVHITKSSQTCPLESHREYFLMKRHGERCLS